MPVFNRQELVSRAIESILNQTFKNFEFIIVDDGSTDATPLILKSYANQDSRIKILTNPQNKGISYSRQRGLDAAKGTYVAIMDSDDWSVPDRLEKSVAFMRDTPDIDAMSGRVFFFEENTFDKVNPDNSSYTFDKGPNFYTIEMSFANFFPNVASMFRRDFVRQHNIRYNLDFISAEDYDFYAQMILADARLASIRNILTYVRKHHTNSETYYIKMTENAINVRRKLLSRFFDPNSVRISYPSLLEKCFLLDKMATANRENHQVPQEVLDTYYAKICPPNMNNALQLSHPYWSDFIVLSDNNRISRYTTGDTGSIFYIDNRVTIKWDKYDPEVFEKQPDGSYKYINVSNPNVFHVQHPYWKDWMALNSKTHKACRMNVADCAVLRKISDNIVHLKWDNPAYGVEKFRKNEQGEWVYTKKLKTKSKTQSQAT